MKPRSLFALVCAVCFVLTVGAAAMADDQERPDEGKVVSIDQSAMSMTLEGKKDDRWTLYWTESTKVKGDVTVEELQVGDQVHFKFTEKDGKKWLTELHRSKKADKD